MGCCVCAWHKGSRPKETHEGRRGCQIRFSEFANYNFFVGKPRAGNNLCGTLVRVFKAHEAHDGHRAAVLAVAKAKSALPSIECESAVGGLKATAQTEAHAEAAVIAESAVGDLNGQGVLRGRVPPAMDWLDA